MTSKPVIEVALKLTGQGFSPDHVTSVLQRAPTKAWRRGDLIQGTTLQRPTDGWAFGLPPRETHEMDAVLGELLDAIEPFRDRIVEAIKQFHLNAEVSFGVYVRNETPAGWFSAENIRRIGILGADLDIDLILTK